MALERELPRIAARHDPNTAVIAALVARGVFLRKSLVQKSQP